MVFLFSFRKATSTREVFRPQLSLCKQKVKPLKDSSVFTKRFT